MAKTKTKPRLLTEKDKFAERLKTARLNGGLTQQVVADTADISRSAIVSYEMGRVVPGAMELTRLAKVLKVSPNYLLCGSENFFGSEKAQDFLSGRDPRLRAIMAASCFSVLDQNDVDSLTALIASLVKAKFPRKDKFDAFNNSLKQATDILQQFLPLLDVPAEQTAQPQAKETQPSKKKKPGQRK